MKAVRDCVDYLKPKYFLPHSSDFLLNGENAIRFHNYIKEEFMIRKNVSLNYDFKKVRNLPEWGEIFSPWCKFVRLDEDEYDKFLLMCSDYLEVFCHIVRTAERETEWQKTMRRYDDQLWYCTSQMKNKKTEAVLSQWFDNSWATKYIQNVLFDKPKL